MTPARRLVGTAETPVLTVDGAGPGRAAVTAIAAALAPFPPAHVNYPGLRRVIDERDAAAWNYAIDLLDAVTPYVAGAFDIDRFDLVEASFSLVTSPANALTPVQRIPHFDSLEPGFFALLHYISPCAGTAFYRHRASGIETVTAATVDRYVAAARTAAAAAPADYIRGDSAAFECIGAVEGVEGRLVGYPGQLLHSGLIPADFAPSADPVHGRLTCNIFIRSR